MKRPTRLACYAAILALIALTQRPNPAMQPSAPEPPEHPLPSVPPSLDTSQNAPQLPLAVEVEAVPAQSPPSGHQFTAIEAKLRRDRDILTTERLADRHRSHPPQRRLPERFLRQAQTRRQFGNRLFQ